VSWVAVALVATQCTVAAWFGVSAVGKLRRPAATAAAFRSYALVPNVLLSVAPLALAGVEAALAGWLILGILSEYSLLASAGLLALFSFMLTTDLLLGRRHDCGCGGTPEAPISWRMVQRNAAVAAVCVGLAVVNPPPLELSQRLFVIAAVIGLLLTARLLQSYRALAARRVWGATPSRPGGLETRGPR